MGTNQALGLMNDKLWNVALIAASVLFITLVVELIISVFQVATQIQEITLSYVPKTIAAGAALAILGPWMIAKLIDFSRSLYLLIPSLGS